MNHDNKETIIFSFPATIFGAVQMASNIGMNAFSQVNNFVATLNKNCGNKTTNGTAQTNQVQ